MLTLQSPRTGGMDRDPGRVRSDQCRQRGKALREGPQPRIFGWRRAFVRRCSKWDVSARGPLVNGPVKATFAGTSPDWQNSAHDATMALPLQRDFQEPVGDGMPEGRFLGPSCQERLAGPAPRTRSGRSGNSRRPALDKPCRFRSASSLGSCSMSGTSASAQVQRYSVPHTFGVSGRFGGPSSRGRQRLPCGFPSRLAR